MGYDMSLLKTAADIDKALAEKKITFAEAKARFDEITPKVKSQGGMKWVGAVNGECIKMSRYSRSSGKMERLTLSVQEVIDLGLAVAKAVETKEPVDGETWDATISDFVPVKMVLTTTRTPFDKKKFTTNGTVATPAQKYTPQQVAYIKALSAKTVDEIVAVLKPLDATKREKILAAPGMSKKAASVRVELGVDMADLPF